MEGGAELEVSGTTVGQVTGPVLLFFVLNSMMDSKAALESLTSAARSGTGRPLAPLLPLRTFHGDLHGDHVHLSDNHHWHPCHCNIVVAVDMKD